MKILFLATWFPHPLDNGSKIRVCYLLRGLAAAGHDVTLLSFAFDTADVAGAHALRALCAEVRAIERNPFQRTERENRLRFLLPVPLVSQPIPEMAEAVRDTLSRRQYDLVIASTATTAAYALMAPAGTARLLEEHNAMTQWFWERYRVQRNPAQRLRCWLSWYKNKSYENRLFPRFDLVTMVSEQDRENTRAMLQNYAGPIEVVPNGVDCGHNRPGLEVPQPGTLVFSGSLSYVMNYDAMRHFLIEIWPLVHQEEPGTSLTITGSIAGVDLSGLPLDKSVRLTGYVDDVRPSIASAWACIVPLRKGGGTRLKVLEAMALGTPVITTSKGVEGYPVVSGEHALVADDPRQFAACVVGLLRDGHLRARLAAAGRKFVEDRYDWNPIGQRFSKLCEDVIGGMGTDGG